MKKVCALWGLLLISNIAIADAVILCGEIDRLRVWADGRGDTYGIWIEYNSNPSQCPGGFYLPHTSHNKNFVYSLLLSAKASKEKVCIQTYPENPDYRISSRCKVNYAMHQ